jgi:hypothetical protein
MSTRLSPAGNARRAVDAIAVAVALAASFVGLTPGAASASLAPGAVGSPLHRSPDREQPGVLQFLSLAASDVWAVGTSTPYPSYTAWSAHWDGTSWTPEPVPAPAGSISAILVAAAAVSADDVYAFGNYLTTGFPDPVEHPLLEHWDGRQWSILELPDQNATYLGAVAVISPTHVVVTGVRAAGDDYLPIAYTWNGRVWRAARDGSAADLLGQIAVISPRDAWSVSRETPDITDPIVEHWNGQRWTRVRIPTTAGGDFAMAVAAPAADSVWIAGFVTDAQLSHLHGWLIHWDGTSWTRVGTAQKGAKDFGLLSFDSPGDGWLTGTNGTFQHWNGSTWRVTRTPLRHYYDPQAAAIDAISADNAWGEGVVGPQVDQYVIMRWNGRAWTRTHIPLG